MNKDFDYILALTLPALARHKIFAACDHAKNGIDPSKTYIAAKIQTLMRK
jgi:hypothetical protein